MDTGDCSFFQKEVQPLHFLFRWFLLTVGSKSVIMGVEISIRKDTENCILCFLGKCTMRRKNPITRNAMHKLWAWGLLEINIINSSIVYAIHTGQLQMLLKGGIIAIICLLYGLNKFGRDVVVNDFSSASVWITYVCTLSLSLILIHSVYSVTSTTAMLYMTCVVLLEGIPAFLISRKK